MNEIKVKIEVNKKLIFITVLVENCIKTIFVSLSIIFKGLILMCIQTYVKNGNI